MYFSFTKLENRRVEQVLWREVLGTSWGGGSRERGRKMNMVQIICTHVCKFKNDSY
jgi:hypothetical protein